MITKSRPLILFIAVVVPIIALLTPTPAHAGAAIGVDLELGAPIATGMAYGASVGARAGYRFDLGPVWIQPEAGGAFTSFQSGRLTPGVDMPRLFGGARLGLGLSRVVQPAIYGQGGIGWLGTVAKGPLGSVGLAVDFALVPHFTFGAQVGYNAIATIIPQIALSTGSQVPGPVFVGTTAAPVPWISAGFHGGFTF